MPPYKLLFFPTFDNHLENSLAPVLLQGLVSFPLLSLVQQSEILLGPYAARANKRKVTLVFVMFVLSSTKGQICDL